MIKKITFYSSLCALFLLSGCSTKTSMLDASVEQTKNTINSDKVKKASTLNNWVLSGAMVARNQTKTLSASVNWQQNGLNQYKIRLFGPLGGGAVMIEKQGTQVSYKDGPNITSATNADQLLQQKTGIKLPVNHLYYWIRGVSAPNSPIQNIEHDKQENITLLKQDGYVIEYLKYMKVGEMYLPNQIRLNGHGVSVKFIIKNWRIA